MHTGSVVNPYLPSWEYVPDGEPHIFNDRLYVFGSHDALNGADYCVGDYVGWSTPIDDLGQWHCDGVIYRRDQDPLNPTGRHRLYAPDVQQGPDGRYYLFYALDTLSVISVAVCDQPTGQYQFYGHVHDQNGALLGQRPGDTFQFDPAILVQNGENWLYTGFCPPASVAAMATNQLQPIIKGPLAMQLADDLLTLISEPVVIMPDVENSAQTTFVGHEFFEAASIRLIQNQYYLVYSSIQGHELCYATAPTPIGPYTYGGVIISNGDLGYHGQTQAQNYYGNNHGGLVKINQQWFIFYHRHTNGNQFSRQGCAEPVELTATGTIAQVEMTSCGLTQPALPGHGTYAAGLACNVMGPAGGKLYGLGDRPMDDNQPMITALSPTADHQIITHITAKAIIGFKYFDLQAWSQLSVLIRGTANGQLLVRTALAASPVVTVSVTPQKTWHSVTVATKSAASRQALYFEFQGTGSLDFSQFTLE